MFRRQNFLACHLRDAYCLVLGLQLGSKVHKNQSQLPVNIFETLCLDMKGQYVEF